MTAAFYTQTDAERLDAEARAKMDALREAAPHEWLQLLGELTGVTRISRSGALAAAYLVTQSAEDPDRALTPGEVACVLDALPHLLILAARGAELCPEFLTEDDGTRTYCALPRNHGANEHVDPRNLVDWHQAFPYSQTDKRLKELDAAYDRYQAGTKLVSCGWCESDALTRRIPVTELQTFQRGEEMQAHLRTCPRNPLYKKIAQLRTMLGEALDEWQRVELTYIEHQDERDPRPDEFRKLAAEEP